jgi:hypothetical protein
VAFADAEPLQPVTWGDRVAVADALAGSKDLASLLAGRAYTVADVTGWYTVRDHVKFGAVATARLGVASAIEGTFPIVDYDAYERTSPAYRTTRHDLAAIDVTELRIFVDLAGARVVGIEPTGPEAQVTRGADTLRRPQQSEDRPAMKPPFAAQPARPTGSTAYGLMNIPHDGGGGIHAIYFNGNRQFYNWDFNGQNTGNPDWPVTLLFTNNANVNHVKDGPLGGKYDQGASCASPMNMPVGPNFNAMIWDEDSGKKTTCCPVTGGATHFRVYADHNDSPHRLYTPDLGYYVPATSHRDVRECGSGTEHGWSEDAEWEIGTDSWNVGWAVYRNSRALDNSVVTSWIGSYYYQNNGWATEVIVW